MSRAVQVMKGLFALFLLVVLVAAVPWALWHYIGWPLPHHLPSFTELTTALDRHGIANTTLLKALACVVWVAWAVFLLSIAVEFYAALRGRAARRVGVARPFQPMVGQLLAVIVVAALAIAPRPGAGPRPLEVAVGGGRRKPPVAAMALVGDRASGPGPGTVPAAAGTGQLSAYVVKRNDTLWGIAERELGDPLRWSEIYALNEGRPEPGGATLDNPNWIYPGWTLLLPASASPPPPDPPRRSAPSTTATPAGAPRSSICQAPVMATPSARSANAHHPTGMAQPAPRTPGAPSAPVRLPSGSVVAGSFAAGVFSALALGRLRRRHAYRYRPPEPGLDLGPAPLRPTLAHLARARDDRREVLAGEPASEPRVDLLGPAPGDEPARVEIARRGEESVAVALSDLSGTALVGPASGDVARALVAGLVVGAGPRAAEVVLAGEEASRLLGEVTLMRAVRKVASSEAAARLVEAERIARTRRLAAASAPDAVRFRRDNPENPLPVLLVLADPPPPESAARWAALAADGGRLDIAVVYLGATPAATASLGTDEERRVTAAPEHLAGRLAGAELFGLREGEASELLDVVAEALEDPEAAESHTDRETGDPASPDYPDAPICAEGSGEPWPEAAWTQAPRERPISVQLFGHLSVAVDGEAVTDGLRSRAKVLLAWYLCRPEGATSEQAVDALWPDTVPEGVLRQFWRAFGDLRARLRDGGADGLDVLVKAGDHYQPAAAEIACDLWDFEAALKDAARTDGDAAREALRRAVDSYKADLLEASDWLWVEPVRADLHRRALDAHLRLAELEEAAGRPDAARAVIERAIELGRYAEEPYRRLMVLHAAAGRPDAVTSTWRLLQQRLAEIDLEAEPGTARLYRRLTEDGAPATDPSGRVGS